MYSKFFLSGQLLPRAYKYLTFCFTNRSPTYTQCVVFEIYNKFSNFREKTILYILLNAILPIRTCRTCKWIYDVDQIEKSVISNISLLLILLKYVDGNNGIMKFSAPVGFYCLVIYRGILLHSFVWAEFKFC